MMFKFDVRDSGEVVACIIVDADDLASACHYVGGYLAGIGRPSLTPVLDNKYAPEGRIVFSTVLGAK